MKPATQEDDLKLRTLRKNPRRLVTCDNPHKVIGIVYTTASKGKGIRTKQSAGRPSESEAEEIAAHIVHCVNTHAALLAALVAAEEAERDEEIYHGFSDGIPLSERTEVTLQRISELRRRMVESATKAKTLRAAALSATNHPAR